MSSKGMTVEYRSPKLERKHRVNLLLLDDGDKVNRSGSRIDHYVQAVSLKSGNSTSNVHMPTFAHHRPICRLPLVVVGT